MKINKKSWHYRLVLWNVKGYFHFPPTQDEIDKKMPKTLCSYLYELLDVFWFMFVTTSITLSVLATVIIMIIAHPHEAKDVLITLPVLCILAFVVFFVYRCIIVFLWEPILEWHLKWQQKHCPKIDYE